MSKHSVTTVSLIGLTSALFGFLLVAFRSETPALGAHDRVCSQPTVDPSNPDGCRTCFYVGPYLYFSGGNYYYITVYGKCTNTQQNMKCHDNTYSGPNTPTCNVQADGVSCGSGVTAYDTFDCSHEAPPWITGAPGFPTVTCISTFDDRVPGTPPTVTGVNCSGMTPGYF